MIGRRALAVGLLLAVTAAVYVQVLGHPFISYDDPEYVADNRHVQDGFTRDSLAWAMTTTDQGNWHPLTWLSHMADWCMCHSRAGGHHAVSVLLHLGATLLLYLALVRMTRSAWPSAIVAGLFALHPLHVESVAWVAERKDVLSGLAAMLALLAYVRYAERPTVLRYALVFVLLALGLAAKPMLVTLPLVLLLLDWWPLGRLKFEVQGSKFKVESCEFQVGGEQGTVARRVSAPVARSATAPSSRGGCGEPAREVRLWRLVIEKVPLLALSAVICVVTWMAQERAGAMSFLRPSLADRLATAATGYVRYLGKAVWPSDLAIIYPYDARVSLWQAIVAAALLAAVTALAVRWRRRRPWLLVGWLWYVSTLVPVIGLVQVGAQSIADRYTYIPLIGIFIAAAWSVAELAGRRPSAKWLIDAGAVAVLAACAVATFMQVRLWSDSITLLEHTVAVTPGNPVALNDLAAELPAGAGDEQAIALLKEAIGLMHEYADAHANLGCRLVARGRRGDLPDAISHLEAAVRLKPDQPRYRYNLGQAYAVAGRHDDAIAEYGAALKTRPDFPLARYKLAISLAAAGRPADAIREHREAIRAADDAAARWDDPAAHALAASVRTDLALLLATCPDDALRDGPEAVRLAEQVVREAGRQPATLVVLAAAYAEAGRFADAIRTGEDAAARADGAGQRGLAAIARQHVELYRRGVAYHAPPQKKTAP